ncbi:ProQ/FINO family protein [Xylophilus sp. GOD-11R]|uniref:ProQ/FINO family protein n=1 Tax=Xylophilus sp. GOD-11R TaxID=3089814 RepID=UPI00298C5608|nr:ProQ/FINO family protein [Xylophilus sp. GOD-11R]WPB56836.1 ProQ/FINO family protein [Xylophilus sp. GOD-11R]
MNATDTTPDSPVAESAATPASDAPSGSSSTVEAGSPAKRPGANRRGGRGGRSGRSDKDAGAPMAATPGAAPARKGASGARTVHPLLEQLAALYPQLFGSEFLPLKRGIFQDLREAHPEQLAPDALKEALGQHTRSTRYLQAIAAARPRHDLAGQVVEALAPEHVYQALIELWRRRGHRTPEAGLAELRDDWRRRIVRAYEASGLGRDAYAELVRTRDEAASALLDEALAEASARAAKDEALLRAFESGNTGVEAFADMYGLDPRQTGQVLDAARRRRELATQPVA